MISLTNCRRKKFHAFNENSPADEASKPLADDNIFFIIENYKHLKTHVCALKEELKLQGLSLSGLIRYLKI